MLRLKIATNSEELKFVFMTGKDNKFMQRAIIVAGIVLISTIAIIFAASRLGNSGDTEIVLNNVGECPKVTMTLRARDNQELITLVAGPGETDKAKVRPDMIYDYQIVTDTDPQADSRPCRLQDNGSVSVPAGATQTFNIASERVPTPTDLP